MKTRSDMVGYEEIPDDWREIVVDEQDVIDIKAMLRDGKHTIMMISEDGKFAASEDGGETFRELVYAEKIGRPVLYGMAVGIGVVLLVQILIFLVVVILELV